jgi:hypothetical protein
MITLVIEEGRIVPVVKCAMCHREITKGKGLVWFSEEDERSAPPLFATHPDCSWRVVQRDQAKGVLRMSENLDAFLGFVLHNTGVTGRQAKHAAYEAVEGL